MPKIIIVDKVESTNFALSEMVIAGSLSTGSMLMARCQLKGRGQRGNSWESEPGLNLTASILLRPSSIGPSDQFYLTKVVSLGVIDFLKRILPLQPWVIKWPNDIFVNNMKIAGILIENVILGHNFDHSIAGIGLNINQKVFLSDAPNPISLHLISGSDYDVDVVAAAIQSAVLNRFRQLQSGNFAMLDTDYLSLLFLRGKVASFCYNHTNLEAIIEGVDQFGRLILSTTNNRNKIVAAFKEIVYLS